MAEEDGPCRSQRRTRSQAAPEWTAVEELVLVNEIAAVEAECQRELSSYQKWKIIAENCAAQDVARTLSQFRRKWDSLLHDYRRVADFQSRPGKTSFWSLDARRRLRLGLPSAFDQDLFAAVRSLLGARPEDDPEDDAAEVALDLGADTVASADIHVYKLTKGSRKKRQRLSSQGTRSWKSIGEDNLSESSAEAKPSNSSAEEKPHQPPEPPSESPTENPTEENPITNPAEEEPQQGSTENQPQTDNTEEEVAVDVESRERMIARLLRENAKRINSIVAESAGHDEDADNTKNSEDGQAKSAEFVRSQGTELISCLGVICKTLDQLCNLAQEC